MLSLEAKRAATPIWNWLRQKDFSPHSRGNYDFVLIHGSSSIATAYHGIEVFQQLQNQGRVELLILTGKRGGKTLDWPKTEADTFADLALDCGVQERYLVKEPFSTNSGDNLKFTKILLEQEKGYNPTRVLRGVSAAIPSVLRRDGATAAKVWPNLVMTKTCVPEGMQTYIDRYLDGDEARLFSVMRGEVHRLRTYHKQGFIRKVWVPKYIKKADRNLEKLGYGTRRVVNYSAAA